MRDRHHKKGRAPGNRKGPGSARPDDVAAPGVLKQGKTPDADEAAAAALAAWLDRFNAVVTPMLPLIHAPTDMKVAIAGAALIQAFAGTIVFHEDGDGVSGRVAFDFNNGVARSVFGTPERAAAAAGWLLGVLEQFGALPKAIVLLRPDLVDRMRECDNAMAEAVGNPGRRDGEPVQ